MAMSKVVLLLFVLIFISINDSFALRRFWKGRHHGGNLFTPTQLDRELLPPDEWFEQQLDHFDEVNKQTWKQRYYVNDKYYKSNGPVFLMIGGEGEARASWMVEGAWVHYAEELNALCIQLEHRFYGKSRPTSDLSIENLKYLSSEQALADLGSFIESMKTKLSLPVGTKWIAFGGSYPGSLAAWLREKYPNLVHGSISSSGPLLAKADFNEYFDVVRNSLGTYSNDCIDAVQKSIQQVELLLKHRIGQLSLNAKFNLCDPVENSVDNILDMSNLFEAFSDLFAGVVQYNKDNRKGVAYSIDDVCKIMTNTSIGPQIDRLAAVNSLLLTDKKKCFDYKYEKLISEMKNTSWDSEEAEGAIQWTFQTCNEFGFYQTSDDKSKLFGDRFPLNFFVKQCTDIYGENFNGNWLDNSIQRTNKYYGALHPNTTNVLYVHGSIDPWHALGLTKSKPNMPAILIEGTAHCANMYEPSENDAPQLRDAREKIRQYLRDLLK